MRWALAAHCLLALRGSARHLGDVKTVTRASLQTDARRGWVLNMNIARTLIRIDWASTRDARSRARETRGAGRQTTETRRHAGRKASSTQNVSNGAEERVEKGELPRVIDRLRLRRHRAHKFRQRLTGTETRPSGGEVEQERRQQNRNNKAK